MNANIHFFERVTNHSLKLLAHLSICIDIRVHSWDIVCKLVANHGHRLVLEFHMSFVMLKEDFVGLVLECEQNLGLV